MKRVDGIVGNRHTNAELEAQLEAHEENGTLERVVLDTGDRRKSRLRLETDAGTDLGILVDQPELSSGDVLFVESDHAAVIEFEEIEAFVIELPEATNSTLLAAVELGHRIGNQHWDVAVEDGTVYVPVAADKSIIESVLGEYLPAGANTRYETVEAELFIDRESIDHGHSDHSHSGDADHSHQHSHSDGSSHDHSHNYDADHSHDHGLDHDHSHDEPDHDYGHGKSNHSHSDGGHSHE